MADAGIPGGFGTGAPRRWAGLRESALSPARGAGFALLLALLLAALFLPVLRGSDSLFARDLFNFHYPLWKATADSFRTSGEIPLWNPLLNFGQNAAGNPNYLLFYPPAWIRFVLEPLAALNLFIVLHLFLGGLAFRALLRRWGADGAAAGWGGAAYALGGVALSLTCLLTLVPWVFLSPLACLALEGVLKRPGPGPAARLALVLSLTVTVFEPLLAFGLGLGLLGRLGIHLGRVGREGSPGRLALALAGALLTAGVITQPLLREGARTLAASPRTLDAGSETALYSRHPKMLHALFVPNPFSVSFGMERTYRGGEYTEGQEPYLVSLFVGASALILGVVALSGRRRGAALALLAAFLAFCLLALGTRAPLLGNWVQGLPLLNQARYPDKLMFFAAFAWTALATLGLSRVRSGGGGEGGGGAPRRFTILLGLALFMAVVGVSLRVPGSSAASLWPVPALAVAGVAALLLFPGRGGYRPWALPLAGALLLAELVVGNRFAVPFGPRVVFLEKVPILEAVRSAEGGFSASRLAVEGFPTGVRYAGKTDSLIWYYRALRQSGTPYPGFTEGAGYGFDFVFDRLDPLGAAAFREASLALPFDARLRLYAAAGVRWLLSPIPHEHPGLERIGLYPTGATYLYALYRVNAGQGRAVVKTAAAPPPPGDPPLQSLLGAGDALAWVPGRFAGEARRLGPPGKGAYPGGIRDDGFNRVEVTTDAPAAGVLVLRDAYDPGWTAWVDGREAPVFPADYIFRGVFVSAGRHRVRFEFHPPGWGWMVPLSLAALAATLCLAFLHRTSAVPRRAGFGEDTK
ncbi:MAG: YfhO family protein [Acidobacteria bacterium]|nr:YfhO family protein [Acidobacteriota bacterium]